MAPHAEHDVLVVLLLLLVALLAPLVLLVLPAVLLPLVVAWFPRIRALIFFKKYQNFGPSLESSRTDRFSSVGDFLLFAISAGGGLSLNENVNK